MTTLQAEFRQIVKRINGAVAETVIAGHDTLIIETPLDTGRLRSAWDTTLNSPSNTKFPEPRKPSGHVKGDDLFSNSKSKSIRTARRVSKSFNVIKNDAVYITDNISYSEVIDSTHHMTAKAKLAMDAELARGLRRV